MYVSYQGTLINLDKVSQINVEFSTGEACLDFLLPNCEISSVTYSFDTADAAEDAYDQVVQGILEKKDLITIIELRNKNE